MRWSVALQASGDRVVELDEVVRLADAVAVHEGVATGMGTLSYGARLVVEAESGEEAVERATGLFTRAVATAGLPVWPIVDVETMADEEQMGWYEEIPEGRDIEVQGDPD